MSMECVPYGGSNADQGRVAAVLQAPDSGWVPVDADGMDVTPSIRIEDSDRYLDLDFSLNAFDLENFDDLTTTTTTTATSNNNEGEQGYVPGCYQVLPYPTVVPQQTILPPSTGKEAENSSDKMWGGGDGGMFYEALVKTEVASHDHKETQDKTIDTSETILPSESNHEAGLTLFSNIMSETNVASHNHRSPGSDSVSCISASGYSDSGISTSPHHHDSEFDTMVNVAIDTMLTPRNEDYRDYTTSVELMNINNTYSQPSYMTPHVDGTTILEGALRGTVRRGPCTTLPPMNKTLTVMTNMAPLPPVATAFKPESMGLPPSQPQITSTNGLYATYDYIPPPPPPPPPEEYTHLDNGVKISPAASTTSSPPENKPKKRKYTKRGTAEDAAAKGRLLHFCSVCNKGFKDKYSVNVHLRTHTGEKPFDCIQCGKCFRQKAHLAKHVQIHNSGQKPPPNKR